MLLEPPQRFPILSQAMNAKQKETIAKWFLAAGTYALLVVSLIG